MKNKNETHKTHKLARTSRDRNERRRLAFEKRNVKKEMNLARYGAEGGTALVIAKTGELNRRFVAAFMALVFALSCLVIGVNFASLADTETASLAPAGTTDDSSGMVLNKYLTPNDDGKYDLTLEAYSTANLESVTEKVPTDFVIIVDQSGSMATTDMPTGTDSYQTVSSVNLETAAAGKYYYYDSNTQQYYRVYGKRGYIYYKYAANNSYADDFYGKNLFYYFSSETTTASGANGYYYYNSDDAKYYPVSMRVSGESITGGFQYKCYFTYNRNGTTTELPYSSSKSYHSYRQIVWRRIDGWSDKIQHDMYKRYIGYTGLYYRDIDGVEHPVNTTSNVTSTEYAASDGSYAVTSVNGSTRMLYSGLYTLKSGSSYVETRLSSLETALNNFATAVASEEDYFGAVDNRVAIVGFSSENGSYKYNNTEVLTGSTIDTSGSGASFYEGSYSFPYYGANYDPATNDTGTNYNGPQYYSYSSSTGYPVQVDDTVYANALVSASNGTVGQVNSNIEQAIKSIGAYGGTQPEDGFVMAKNIFNKRSEKKYTMRLGDNAGTEVDRNMIVIFFTDGQPGNYPYSNQYTEANEVVAASKEVKDLGATVFSIGVFGESDGNPLTYRKSSTAYSSATDDAIYDVDYAKYYQYSSNTYYYLYRYWLSGQQTNYGDTPNDTIFDYMSVVSSDYPDATSFYDSSWSTSSSESWLTMTDRVRSTSTSNGTNDCYRMASNQDTLVAAFEQAVSKAATMKSNSIDMGASAVYIQDALNTSGFTVDSNPTITYETEIGTIDSSGNVTFDSETRSTVTGLTSSFTNDELTVSGFDYSTNYIAYGKAADPTNGTDANQGKKLIVTIKNVYPTTTGNVIYSNADGAGIYSTDSGGTLIASFPKPSVSRHSYTVNVGDVKRTATFSVETKIVNDNGTTVSKDDPALKDVILVSPDGTRQKYSAAGTQPFTGVGNEYPSFYYENLPDNYNVAVSITTNDDTHTYTSRSDSDVQETQMPTGTAVPYQFDYNEHNLYITSVSNYRNVSITEQTKGDYGDPSLSFDEVITMDIPGLTSADIGKNYDFECTVNNGFTDFDENDWIQNADSYVATFTVRNVDGTPKAVLSKIVSEKAQVGVKTLTIDDGKLPMRDQDRITFSIPRGYSIYSIESDSHDYDLSYYVGQNNVKANTILLTNASGTPLSGEYNLAFGLVDQQEAESGSSDDGATITFTDGRVSALYGQPVSPTSDIPVGLFSYATLKSNDAELNGAKLTLDGTSYTFEADGNNSYVVELKPEILQGPATATVLNTDMDIIIINEKEDIPVTGINDSNHNWIIYILAALGGLAAIGAGIFLWKKRNEFVEG